MKETTLLLEDIFVTKTYLPELKEYTQLLKKIWDSRQVTNNGPFVKQLEDSLSNYLGVQNLNYVSNGTIALQLAIQALDLQGTILTTPLTYIATATSIIWQNCTPIFVDIDESSLTIDTKLLGSKIQDDTSAILAVHTYGYPCDIIGLEEFCKENDLRLIFDAAHTFGVKFQGKSLAEYGDISTLSFHATKVFHTIEGGAVIVKDKDISDKIRLAKSFGHRYDDYLQLGINAKNSELHAGIGLLNLETINDVIKKRKEVFDRYLQNLKHSSVRVLSPCMYDGLEYNYAYMVSIYASEEELLEVKNTLEKNNVYPRRYFYPSLNTIPYLHGYECPVAVNVSERILCLPLYHELELDNVDHICNIIKETIRT